MKKKIYNAALVLIGKSQFLQKLYNQHAIRTQMRFVPSQRDIAAAEMSDERKACVVEASCKKWASAAAKLEEEIAKKQGSSVSEIDPLIHTDVLFCFFAYGFSVDDYFAYHLAEKDVAERKTYISDRDVYLFALKLNNYYDMRRIFGDKANTYLMFKDYFKRDAVVIESEKDYSSFIRFIEGKKEFVKKPVYESWGNGIELVSISEWHGRERELFSKLISSGKLLLEERVYSHECLSVFNESSVNTIRVVTVYTRSGITVPFSFLKVGRDGSFVDNGGAGGILVGMDEETGVTNTNGFDEQGREYEVHPDSGVVFKGYQIPDYDKAVSMAREMSAKVPSVKYIGWDFAYTDKGWVAIEGNMRSQMIAQQSTIQHGIRKKVAAIMDACDTFV